jgi:hypothetical protein
VGTAADLAYLRTYVIPEKDRYGKYWHDLAQERIVRLSEMTAERDNWRDTAKRLTALKSPSSEAGEAARQAAQRYADTVAPNGSDVGDWTRIMGLLTPIIESSLRAALSKQTEEVERLNGTRTNFFMDVEAAIGKGRLLGGEATALKEVTRLSSLNRELSAQVTALESERQNWRVSSVCRELQEENGRLRGRDGLCNDLFAVLMGAKGLLTMCREHFIERELAACDGNFLYAPECLTALLKIKAVEEAYTARAALAQPHGTGGQEKEL